MYRRLSIQIVLTASSNTYELVRLSTNFNGLTTLSRTVLVSLNAGDTISALLIGGSIDAAATVSTTLLGLTSLTVFRYELASASIVTAPSTVYWSTFRDANWTVAGSDVDLQVPYCRIVQEASPGVLS
jgi:hypothetical protein